MLKNPALRKIKSRARIKAKIKNEEIELTREDVDNASKYCELVSLLYSISTNSAPPSKVEYIHSPAIYNHCINLLGFKKEAMMKGILGV